MIPAPAAYGHSLSSSLPMPLDLNEDQNHKLFCPNLQASSSSSSLSYPINFFHPDHQQGSYCWDPKPLLSDHEQGEKNTPCSGSWDHGAAEEKDHESSSGLKLTINWKKENRVENFEGDDEDEGSAKWMSSKMRMMRKMMVTDQRVPADVAENSEHNKFEDQKQQPFQSLESTDHNSSNNCSNHSNIAVRVCSDCHTTKTPLWRSGPRGPKSLCNACGIRQRKARRAMAAAAAASANGAVVMSGETCVKRNKLHKKKNKSKIEKIEECAPTQLKKKRKLGATKPSSRGRKNFGFEDLRLRLSNKYLALQQVFPQDEKEAAILLMALSYGLVQG